MFHKKIINTMLFIGLLNFTSCGTTQNKRSIHIGEAVFFQSAKKAPNGSFYQDNDGNHLEIDSTTFRTHVEAKEFFYNKRLYVKNNYQLISNPYMASAQDNECLNSMSLSGVVSTTPEDFQTYYLIVALDQDGQLNFCEKPVKFFSRLDFFLKDNTVTTFKLSMKDMAAINKLSPELGSTYIFLLEH